MPDTESFSHTSEFDLPAYGHQPEEADVTHIAGSLISIALLAGSALSVAAAPATGYKPLDHQQNWGYRASMGVGGFWGAPRVYARPITVGAYAECQWVRVTTPYGARWQAVCE